MSETLPPSLYAIVPPAPCWLNDNIAVSRGYFDDACDGIVEVRLKGRPGRRAPVGGRAHHRRAARGGARFALRAQPRRRSRPGDLRTRRSRDESFEDTRARAEDIVRRAFETVRFMNVAVMNGNPFDGRDPLTSTPCPPRRPSTSSGPMRPVIRPRDADTLAIMRLHQQVFAALRGGAAPWFRRLLRQPEEVADFTDHGRRKMPALMCGADGNYLALTHRQINTIFRAAGQPIDLDQRRPDIQADQPEGRPDGTQPVGATSPDVNFVARGNPVSSRPVSRHRQLHPGPGGGLPRGVAARVRGHRAARVRQPRGRGRPTRRSQHLLGRRLLRISCGREAVLDDGDGNRPVAGRHREPVGGLCDRRQSPRARAARVVQCARQVLHARVWADGLLRLHQEARVVPAGAVERQDVRGLAGPVRDP